MAERSGGASVTNQPITVIHRGTLRIVSSGYADRYVQSFVWVEFVVDGLTFRVSHTGDAPRAYLKLANLPETEGHLMGAALLVVSAPYVMSITASTDTGTITVQTTSERLHAGIAKCTGRLMTPRDATLVAGLGDELTANEWQAIYASLDAINREHALRGRPIVEYTRQT